MHINVLFIQYNCQKKVQFWSFKVQRTMETNVLLRRAGIFYPLWNILLNNWPKRVAVVIAHEDKLKFGSCSIYWPGGWQFWPLMEIRKGYYAHACIAERVWQFWSPLKWSSSYNPVLYVGQTGWQFYTYVFLLRGHEYTNTLQNKL